MPYKVELIKKLQGCSYEVTELHDLLRPSVEEGEDGTLYLSTVVDGFTSGPSERANYRTLQSGLLDFVYAGTTGEEANRRLNALRRIIQGVEDCEEDGSE